MEQSLDTMYVQLSFTENVFTEESSLFRCDYLEARDGGLPFLTVLDVVQIGKRSFADVPLGVKQEFIEQMLKDPKFFDVNSPINEFRLRSPILFDANLIEEVTTFIMPSFYGIAFGTAFIADTPLKQRRSMKENEFIIRKTRKPEVYELYLDGLQPVPGNNIAYVPTIELSKKLKAFFSNRNSASVTCRFQEDRQKWIPEL
jgi:hypothetical protein